MHRQNFSVRRRQSRKGFTLMEILLVAAILVILASMATIAILNIGESATQRIALSEIKNFQNACILYKVNNQSFPARLEDLFNPPQGMSKQQWGGPYLENGDIFDPWNNKYTYAADEENNRVIINSPGPDRKVGTDDDVSNAKTSST